MKRDELTRFLDSALDIAAYAGDVSNNGLQVEGADEVDRVVFGVDASLELFEAAAMRGARFVVVHHGLSWGGEPRYWRGVVGNRFRALFKHDISLYAAHLPIDSHPKLGHNAQLADFIGMEARRAFFPYHGIQIGFCGTLPSAATAPELADRIGSRLISAPQTKIYGDPDRPLRSVAVVSGGAGSEAVTAAVEAGADALITGEVYHEMYPMIMESGLVVVKLGHYASETPGLEAVRRLVEKTFNLPGEFVELPTGL
ncbi:MAG: Nif3-like dinuclear metal center hexameric protein [Victivallaceae bacterium]|nr:Nif3-like dinuclear metal center hexameric protein [Victivallaceae bacterium]